MKGRSSGKSPFGPKFLARLTSLTDEDLEDARRNGLLPEEYVAAEEVFNMTPEEYASWKVPDAPTARERNDQLLVVEGVLRALRDHPCFKHEPGDAGYDDSTFALGRQLENDEFEYGQAEDVEIEKEAAFLARLLDDMGAAGKGRNVDAFLVYQVWRQLASFGKIINIPLAEGPTIWPGQTKEDQIRQIAALPNVGRSQLRAIEGADWLVRNKWECPKHPRRRLIYAAIAEECESFGGSDNVARKAIAAASRMLR